MSVEDVADELYALPPEKFTAARTSAAKADKAAAKDINALRKPTVGAWLVNTLVRAEPELLDQLLALGPALAKAQSAGQGAELRELGEQRRQLVSAVSEKAFEAAEREPTAALRAEVESTLEAALADPATAEAVRTGRLTRALSYAGFGGVDLDGAVAVGSAKGARGAGATKAKPAVANAAAKAAARPDRSKDIAAAEARALDTAGELDDAVRACQAAQHAQDEADQAEQRAAEAAAAAEEALREAREQRAAAEHAARQARHQTEQAAATVKAAQAKAEKARAALDKLRRD